jgi:hypothetical protein
MPPAEGLPVDLETAHIFDNQWNTAPIEGISAKGLRVFDWAEDHPINFSNNIKRGHYLDITEDMRAVRRNTVACGYCGKQYRPAPEQVFCDACLGSEYLKETNLHLLRLRPVAADGGAPRAPLTDEEKRQLTPAYVDAQINGRTERDKARIAAKRADVAKRYEDTIRNATTEHDGFVWLMDRGVNLGNVIYYNHTGRFCFGWRQPLTGAARGAMLAALVEFPFPYDVE